MGKDYDELKQKYDTILNAADELNTKVLELQDKLESVNREYALAKKVWSETLEKSYWGYPDLEAELAEARKAVFKLRESLQQAEKDNLEGRKWARRMYVKWKSAINRINNLEYANKLLRISSEEIRNSATRQERNSLHDLLEKLVWTPTPTPICPLCKATKEYPDWGHHRPGCEIDAVLRGKDAQTTDV